MERHPELCVKLFKEGYNCSQAVLGAYCKEIGLEFETAVKLSSSFGGGMGRLREVCGAVTAMFMIAGLKSGYADPKDKSIKQKHYELIQQLSQRFKDKNGSIICRELLGLGIRHDSPVPDERTTEYYKKRPCVELVKCAAEIIDEVLNKSEASSY
ncbi:MAG: C-GCAxxG-C-C family protein [Clostridia bacterium]|nr:C-GCAxxG-C-C family protein [Clostridia bacterium]